MAVCPWADQSRRYDAAYPMSYVASPWRGVLHTTETPGVNVPGYDSGAKAPHFTLVADPAVQQVRVWQHFDTARPSRALRNLSGGVETNRAHAVQIEIVGTSGWITDPRYFRWSTAPTWAMDGLARLMRWIEAQHGIPAVFTARPLTYPPPANAKMTAAEWRSFSGWCGHSNVPENDHGDPGWLDQRYLIHGTPQEEDDMPLTQADAQLVAAAVMGWPLPPVKDPDGKVIVGDPSGKGVAVSEWIRGIHAAQIREAAANLTRDTALAGAVRSALASLGVAVDAEQLAGLIAAELVKGTTVTVTAAAPQ